MIVVAENITVTHRAVADAISQRNLPAIASLARKALSEGADFLDINIGPRRKNAGDDLAFVLAAIADVWPKGIWIDTTDAGLMEQALELWKGQVVLNGYNPGVEREDIARLAGRENLDVVLFLMRGGKVAASADEKLSLAMEGMGELNSFGVPTDNVIIDPLVAPMGWMDGQRMNAELLAALRGFPSLFGEGVRSVVGLSNLVTGSTGQNRVEWLEEVYLAAAMGAGMTHVLCDVTKPGLMRTVRALKAIANQKPYAPADFL